MLLSIMMVVFISRCVSPLLRKSSITQKSFISKSARKVLKPFPRVRTPKLAASAEFNENESHAFSASATSKERKRMQGQKRVQEARQSLVAWEDCNPSRRVAIIGGGIAGSALAVLLQNRGICCRIFERDRSPEARKQGYALTLQQVQTPDSICLHVTCYNAYVYICLYVCLYVCIFILIFVNYWPNLHVTTSTPSTPLNINPRA